MIIVANILKNKIGVLPEPNRAEVLVVTQSLDLPREASKHCLTFETQQFFYELSLNAVGK